MPTETPAVVTGPANVEAPANPTSSPAMPGVVFNFGMGAMGPQLAAQSPALSTPAPVAPTSAPAVLVAPADAQTPAAKSAPEGSADAPSKPTYSQLAAKLAEMEAAQLRGAVESVVLAKAQPQHAKIVRGLLAAHKVEGAPEAAAQAALEALTKEYPELFTAPAEAPQGAAVAPQTPAMGAGSIPSLPPAVHSPNGVNTQRIGIYDAKGQRVL